MLRIGAVLYGGNFAVRRAALSAIGGFEPRSSSTARTRISAGGCRRSAVELTPECFVYTSARRYKALGKRRGLRLYVRNFWSEIVHHRPDGPEHWM